MNRLVETKQVGGNIMILVIRPQEAVAAIQSLLLAYGDYFGAVADYNRAQFALYRALGNPAQLLNDLGAKQPESTQPAPAPVAAPGASPASAPPAKPR